MFEVLAQPIRSGDIKNNSLTTKDVMDGSLTGKDIKDGGITSPDIKNEGIFSRDIKDGQVKTADLADGAVTAAKLARGVAVHGVGAHAQTANVDDTLFDGVEGAHVLSVQIVAPVAGVLMVTGGTDANGVDGDGYLCSLRLGDATTNIVGTAREVGATLAHCMTSGGVTVAAGTHTLHLHVEPYSTDPSTLDFRAASLQVMFMPGA